MARRYKDIFSRLGAGVGGARLHYGQLYSQQTQNAVANVGVQSTSEETSIGRKDVRPPHEGRVL